MEVVEGRGSQLRARVLTDVNNVDCRQGRRWGQEGLQIPALGVMLPSPLRYAASREDHDMGSLPCSFSPRVVARLGCPSSSQGFPSTSSSRLAVELAVPSLLKALG